MRPLTAFLSMWIVLQAAAIYCVLRAARSSYWDGRKDGYKLGFADGEKQAHRFWVGADLELDQELHALALSPKP